MTLKYTFMAFSLLGSLFMASPALAYLSPEDVLLNKALYLPPEARESQDRVAAQSRVSAERRTREQEILFDAQHPTAEASSTSQGTTDATSAEDLSLTAEDLNLLRTIRLLNRVDQNQRVLQYGGRALTGDLQDLHGGAPPLAPTGAGGALSAIVMVSATLWTLWRAKRQRAVMRG